MYSTLHIPSDIPVERERLKPGDAGVVQTIGKMRAFSLRDKDHDAVRAIAQRCKGPNDWATIQCLFDYVVRNVRYRHDPPDVELVKSPWYILTDGQRWGDCDDLSTLLTSVLASAGFRTAFKVIAWRKHAYTHVYCLVYYPEAKGWIPLDPVARRVGYERTSLIRQRVFKVN